MIETLIPILTLVIILKTTSRILLFLLEIVNNL